jgi:hypothetical protein
MGFGTIILQTVRFEGDAGKHIAGDGRECDGRSFDIKFSGSGGVHADFVSCTSCGGDFVAYQNALGPKPVIPLR